MTVREIGAVLGWTPFDGAWTPQVVAEMTLYIRRIPRRVRIAYGM
jgi:hypothetical protein